MWKCYLAELMKERNLPQYKVAEETGISEPTIARLYHNNSIRVELRVLDVLTEYFNLEDGSELFRYEKKR